MILRALDCNVNEPPTLLFTLIKDLSAAQKQAVLHRYAYPHDREAGDFVYAELEPLQNVSLDARGADVQAVRQWLDQYVRGVEGIYNDIIAHEAKKVVWNDFDHLNSMEDFDEPERKPEEARLLEKLMEQGRILSIYVVASPKQAKELEAVGERLHQLQAQYPEYELPMPRWDVLPVQAEDHRPADEIVAEYAHAARNLSIRALQGKRKKASAERKGEEEPLVLQREPSVPDLSPAERGDFDQRLAFMRDQEEGDSVPGELKREDEELRWAQGVVARYGRGGESQTR